MTESELQELCTEWQQRLRLGDWEVVVRVVGTHEFGDVTTLGECDAYLKKKRAVIRLLTPAARRGDGRGHWEAFEDGMELTLVHELLHLHFWPYMHQKGPTEAAQEFTIHALSQALVDLKRERETPE